MDYKTQFGTEITIGLNKESVAKTSQDIDKAKSTFKEKLKGIQVGFNFSRTTGTIKTLQDAISQMPKELSKVQTSLTMAIKDGDIKGIEDAQDRIQRLKGMLSELKTVSAIPQGSTFFGIGEYGGGAMNVIDRMRTGVKGLIGDTGKFKAQWDKVSSGVKTVLKQTGRLVSTIRQYAFALLGTRALWSFISKSMRTYLSYNEELSNKLQAVYYAIGSLFAPILEYIVGLLIKAVGYIDSMVKAVGLAGINMNGFTKSTNKATEAAKKLASFDEINNIGDHGTSGSSTPNLFDSPTLNPNLEMFLDKLALVVKDVFFKWEDLDLEEILMKSLVAEFGLAGLMVGGVPGMMIGMAIGLLLDTVIFDNDGLVQKQEFIKASLASALAGAIIGFKVGGPGGAVIGALITMGLTLFMSQNNGILFDFSKLNGYDLMSGLLSAIVGGVVGFAIGGPGGAALGAFISLGLSFLLGRDQSLFDLTGLDEECQKFVTWITNKLKTLFMFALTGGAAGGLVGSIIGSLGGPIGTATGALIGSVVFTAVGGLADSIAENWDRITEIGRDIIRGMQEGIESFRSTIDQWFKEHVADPIINAVKKLFGINSPSTVFMDIGKWIIEGFKLGITSSFSSLLSTIGSELSQLASEVVRGLNEGLGRIGETIRTKVKNIFNSYVIDPLNRLISWINDRLHFSYSGLHLLGKTIIPAFNVRLANLGSIPRLATGTNYVPTDMIAEIHKGEAVIPREFNSEQYFNNDETNDLLRQLIDLIDTKEFRTYITESNIGKAAVKYIKQQSRIMGGSVV